MTKLNGASNVRHLVIVAILMLLSIGLVNLRPTTAADADTPLDVLQYNVQFLTPWNFGEFSGHWPNVESRAVAIGQAIACYDIVALNETVNNTRRDQIIRAMEAAAPSCGKPSFFSNRYFDVVDGPDLPDGFRIFTPGDIGDLIDSDLPLIDDEVSIVSRLPLIRVHSHIYQASSGLDGFAAKGVLHARLWRGAGAPANDAIDVFATHLQAGDAGVRQAQLEELTEFIRRHSEPGIPIMLLGDFNVNGTPIDHDGEGRPIFGEEYSRMMDLLEEVGLVDIGTHLGGTNEDSDPNKHRKERIDYIFVSSGGLGFNRDDIRVEEFPDSRFSTLSDHAAIEASLAWQTRSPLPMPALGVPKNVSIEVTELRALSSDACNVFMDFYGELELDDGSARISEDFGVHEGNHIGPDWRVVKEIQPQVPAVTSLVRVWDEDDILCGGGDDTVDVNPLTDAKEVPLHIDLVNHHVYLTNSDGQAIRYLGQLNRPIFLRGTNGDENAQLVIVVAAEALDVSPPVPPPISRPRDITVIVERLTATSEDSCEEMEFYGEIAVQRGAVGQRSFGIINGDDVLPNWTVEAIAAAGVPSVDVRIRVREDDDLVCGGGDDDVDVNPDATQTAAIVRVDLVSGTIRQVNAAGETYGAPIGVMGRSIILQGYNGDETARMTFRVNVAKSDLPVPVPIDRNRYTTLTINRLLALQDDSCEAMEFYAKEMRLENGASASGSFGVTEGDDIAPNWSISSSVAAGVTSFDAFVNIDEEDDFVCGGGDDNVDINPLLDERDLRFRTYLTSNELKLIDAAGNVLQAPDLPEVLGFVGRPVTLRGTQDSERAEVTFQVDVALYCEVFPGAPSCLVPSLVTDIDSFAFDEDNAEKGMALSIENKNAPVVAEWRASATEPWVQFSKISGQTPAEIIISIDRGSLSGGLHEAIVQLSSPDAPGNVLEIPVRVNLPADQLASEVDLLVFEPSHEGAELVVPLTNRNTPYSIPWTATASEPWIELGSTSGSTPHELSVSVDGTGLAPGDYHGTITVAYGAEASTAAASENEVEIPVEMRIAPDGLVLSASEVLFNTYAGITSATVGIENLNRLKSVRWQAVSDQPWLKVNVASGSTPAEIELRFESAEHLPEGEYTATVTFVSPDVAGAMVVLQVKAMVEHFKTFQSLTNNRAGSDLIVETIAVNENGSLIVVIKNVGSIATTSPFWVDMYIDPHPAPTRPNDIWADGRSRYGMVWHIDPFVQAGETVTLAIGDPNFRPSLSRVPNSLRQGTLIYAQVDSANTETNYGGVHEMHEVVDSSSPYNNILSIELEQSITLPSPDGTANQSDKSLDVLPLRPLDR
jgi:endonuclease/exonuclease/phosphatase family metal-dependent hydrolase